MAKIIAAFNQTFDGFCDHTAGIPDEEVHNHYTALLNESDTILYGRVAYELMGYWQTLLAKPSGEPSMDNFAKAIDRIPKIVFSSTLKTTGWDSATLADKPLEQVVAELKQQPGGNVLVGSRSLIVQLANLDLIDEYQLCVYPVIIGTGLPLFKGLDERRVLKFLKTKTFTSGTMLHYYEPASPPASLQRRRER